MEITGIAEDPADKKKASLAAIACSDTNNIPEGLDVVPISVLELLREQCLIIQSSASSLYRAARLYAANRTKPSLLSVNALEFNDGNELSLAAIDQGKNDGLYALKFIRISFYRSFVIKSILMYKMYH